MLLSFRGETGQDAWVKAGRKFQSQPVFELGPVFVTSCRYVNVLDSKLSAWLSMSKLSEEKSRVSRTISLQFAPADVAEILGVHRGVNQMLPHTPPQDPHRQLMTSVLES